jgi:hypothetical protein
MVSAATMTAIANRFAWIRATVQRRIGEDRRVSLDQHPGVAEVINEHFSEKLGTASFLVASDWYGARRLRLRQPVRSIGLTAGHELAS